MSVVESMLWTGATVGWTIIMYWIGRMAERTAQRSARWNHTLEHYTQRCPSHRQ